MVEGFILSLNVAEIIWLSGTPVARFVGIVVTTTGQTPLISTKSSFAHPEIKTTDAKARAVRNFLAFIIFKFKFIIFFCDYFFTKQRWHYIIWNVLHNL